MENGIRELVSDINFDTIGNNFFIIKPAYMSSINNQPLDKLNIFSV